MMKKMFGSGPLAGDLLFARLGAAWGVLLPASLALAAGVSDGPAKRPTAVGLLTGARVGATVGGSAGAAVTVGTLVGVLVGTACATSVGRDPSGLYSNAPRSQAAVAPLLPATGRACPR